jgi:hypothetical protein
MGVDARWFKPRGEFEPAAAHYEALTLRHRRLVLRGASPMSIPHRMSVPFRISAGASGTLPRGLDGRRRRVAGADRVTIEEVSGRCCSISMRT